MSIRRATLDDLPRLLKYCEAFQKESPWCVIPFNRLKMESFLRGLMVKHSGCLLISDYGMIAGIITPHPFISVVGAQEVLWYTSKKSPRGGFKLLSAFEEWAGDNGATAVMMSTLGDTPTRLNKLLKRFGYQQFESSLVKFL